MASPSVAHYRLFIDGKSVDTSTHYEIRYPYDGATAATAARGAQHELNQAIESAVRAFPVTRRMSRADRARVLSSMSAAVASRVEEFAREITLCTGKPISYSRAEVTRTVGVLALAAEETKRFGGDYEPLDFDAARRGAVGIVERCPIGPIAAIAPFNFPLNLVTHKVAPAIATGNPIIVKPPPQCPAAAAMLAEIAVEAGLPHGAFNVVECEPEVAQRLASDERIAMLSFTGSARVGWALKAMTKRQRVALELGGNGGLIVDDSADIDHAAASAARGAFVHAGQVCLSVQRIFVHRSIYREFLRRLVYHTECFPLGDPMNDETLCGPLISTAAADRVMDWIAEAKAAGANILTGNVREGAVVSPTLIELHDPSMRRVRVWSEEVFGPVATVEAIDSFDEGIRLTNDSPYGLQAGVFTNNLEHAFKAFREIDVGAVIVGETGVFRVDTYPFGGVKGSGIGREGVKYAMDEMTVPRMLVLNLSALANQH